MSTAKLSQPPPTGNPVLDITTQLIVAIIGAGAGAYFGLRFARNWDRQKKQDEDNQTRIDVIDSLIAELNSNREQLSQQLAIYSSRSLGIYILAWQAAF